MIFDSIRLQYSQELQRHFGADERRIYHAPKVLAYAERILDGERVDDKRVNL